MHAHIQSITNIFTHNASKTLRFVTTAAVNKWENKSNFRYLFEKVTQICCEF